MKNRKLRQLAFKHYTDMVLPKHLLISVFALFFLGATTVSAQEKSADEWQYDATIYLWGSTINQTTGTGDEILINFGTILKNLDFAAMGTFGARKGKFSMLTDVIYMNIGDSKKYDGEFLGQSVTGKLEVGLESWVLNFVGGYNVFDNGKDIIDITAGARFVDVEVEAPFKVNDNTRILTATGNVWDGVVGFKGRHNFPDGYYLNYYADVGGGGSSLTWQTLAGISYDYKKFTSVVGYRYLKWNFGKDTPAVDDMAIHGPYLGAKFTLLINSL